MVSIVSLPARIHHMPAQVASRCFENNMKMVAHQAEGMQRGLPAVAPADSLTPGYFLKPLLRGVLYTRKQKSRSYSPALLTHVLHSRTFRPYHNGVSLHVTSCGDRFSLRPGLPPDNEQSSKGACNTHGAQQNAGLAALGCISSQIQHHASQPCLERQVEMLLWFGSMAKIRNLSQGW